MQPTAPRIALVVAAMLLPGCRFGEMASHNLDVVLSSEDRYRYVGDLQGPLEYLITGFVDPSQLQDDSFFAADANAPIVDPTDVVVENLLELGGSTDGPRSWRQAEEVRQFARYAIACPSGLGRERALMEIVPHGLRLQLDEPWLPPDEVANAAEVRSRLEGLVDAARGLLAQGRSADATAEADFRAACQVLGEATFDVAGGRRVLRVVSPLLRQSRLGDAPRAALVDLSNQVQRQLVSEALARGLRDRLDYVRAAAVKANAAVYGDAYLMEAVLVSASVQTYLELPQSFRNRWRRFELPAEPIEAEEARVALFQELRERGLPAAARGDDVEALTNRLGVLIPVVQVAINYTVFTGRSRMHAMLALEELTGAGLDSLREEDWAAWWAVEGPRLQQRLSDARAGALKTPTEEGRSQGS